MRRPPGLPRPVSFSIDEAALRRAFLLNSKKFHPDFHTLETDERQAEILELSTKNNAAFQTLNDADRRMRYVLQLNGLMGDETKNKALPPDFLMEMMEINESLMDLELDFESEKLATTTEQIRSFENELWKTVAPVVENWSAATNRAGELEAVEDYFLKKRYLLRVEEKLSTFARR